MRQTPWALCAAVVGQASRLSRWKHQTLNLLGHKFPVAGRAALLRRRGMARQKSSFFSWRRRRRSSDRPTSPRRILAFGYFPTGLLNAEGISARAPSVFGVRYFFNWFCRQDAGSTLGDA